MNKKSIRKILGGFKSYVPGGVSIRGTGGTDSARYCYTIWLRHLSILYKNGFTKIPNTIAELGPGDSIGTGLAGLLSGSKKFYALDVVEHTDIKKNISVFDELVTLFANHSALPDDNEFPRVLPRLTSYNFPSEIFADNNLENFLDKSRIQSLRNELVDIKKQKNSIKYMCPWNDPKIIESDSVDVVFSQAVLEHVRHDEFESTMQECFRLLKSDGLMSHEIDFKDHLGGGLNNMRFSTKMWEKDWFAAGSGFYTNRLRMPEIISICEKVGFLVEVRNFVCWDVSQIKRKHLAKEFNNLTDYDLSISKVHLIMTIR